MNEAYSRLTGIDAEDSEDMCRFIRLHYGVNGNAVREVFQRADHSIDGSYSEALFKRKDGKEILLKAKVFLLYSYGDHKLYMSTILQE